MKIMLLGRAGVLLGLMMLSGCVGFNRQTPVKMLHYQCGTLPLTVTLQQNIQPEEVHFLLDGERLQLPLVASASGSKYSNNRYTFWRKGELAFIERGGYIIADDCLLQNAP